MEQKIKEIYREMIKHEDYHTMEFGGSMAELVMNQDEGYVVLSWKGKKWKIQGQKRLRVTEIKSKPKTKKSKGPKPNYTTEVCKNCGKEYQKSKFNPHLDECAECRNPKKQPAQPVDKTCDVCGEVFTASKFNPYLTTCKTCSRKKRQELAKHKRHAKKIEHEEKTSASLS